MESSMREALSSQKHAVAVPVQVCLAMQHSAAEGQLDIVDRPRWFLKFEWMYPKVEKMLSVLDDDARCWCNYFSSFPV